MVFEIASIVNGIAHPMLAAVAHGYFPGLVTSPVVGVLGVLLSLRFGALTESSAESGVGAANKHS
jgi:hypothetical protein